MKATEMLNKIRTYLGEETTDIVENIEEKVEFAQAKLENGTVLEAEAFEAGNEIFIVSEDEKVAVPVGEYEMEDGKILVVAEEGLIAEIKDAESEEEVEAEKEEMGYVTKEELAEAVSEIKAMIEDMKKDKEEMSEEVEKEETELSEELSQAAAEPIAHNPEQKNNNIGVKFAQNRRQTTLDKVLSKINN
jgi:hypothetical protein